MPEEETELTRIPKKKEKEEIAKKIEPKHIIGLAFITIFVVVIYAYSTEFKILIQENFFWVVVVGFLTYWWLIKRSQTESLIGMVMAKKLGGQWVEYNQRIGDMPKGNFTINQAKRKKIDELPKEYLFDVRIKTGESPRDFLVGIDSKSGDVILSEPAIITRLSEEKEAKDVYTKKRLVTKETEWEEGLR